MRPHLLARYSSILRRCAAVAEALSTMISPTSAAGVEPVATVGAPPIFSSLFEDITDGTNVDWPVSTSGAPLNHWL